MTAKFSRRILVVDDEPEIVNIIVKMFESKRFESFDFEFDTAYDGKAALAALNDQVYDIVVIDIQMPGMPGDQTIYNVRSGDGPNKDVPFVIISGNLMGLETAPDKFENVFFVEKPFIMERVERIAKIWLARGSG